MASDWGDELTPSTAADILASNDSDNQSMGRQSSSDSERWDFRKIVLKILNIAYEIAPHRYFFRPTLPFAWGKGE